MQEPPLSLWTTFTAAGIYWSFLWNAPDARPTLFEHLDLEALAIITCEMLTDQRPAGEFSRRLPGCWRDFFNWSLAHEPSRRLESVDEFLERFEHCAAAVLGQAAVNQQL